eukprot:12090530-Karenia_brevis.AAC.1
MLHTTDGSDSSEPTTPPPPYVPPSPMPPPLNPGGASASVRERGAPPGDESPTIIMDDEVAEAGDSPSDA